VLQDSTCTVSFTAVTGGNCDCSGDTCTSTQFCYDNKCNDKKKGVVNKVIENARVGGWGGSCTCPNGEVYQVGDNVDYCRSLACVGGTSGHCNKKFGPWSRRKVICGGAAANAVEDEISIADAEFLLKNQNSNKSMMLNIISFGLVIFGIGMMVQFWSGKKIAERTPLLEDEL